MNKNEKNTSELPEEYLVEVDSHPMDYLLRQDRIPHIWCSGCGLGPATTCYIKAIQSSGIPLNKHICVSGIGCTGRVAGYVNIDTYHTTHGRPIPFATGLKVANPELEVTVFSGDGDIMAIGGNHFIHAARRNIDLNVICVNNFNYGMTGGQGGPTTPEHAKTTTTPYGCLEYPFNLPYLAAVCGAVFVARWTSLHVRQLEKAMERMMQKKGFAFVEVVSPCPIGFGRPNKLGTGIDEMRFYKDHAVIDDNANLAEIGLDMKKDTKIVCGNFVDIEKPDFFTLNQNLIKRLAEKKEVKK
jgi:2-oxoglutarate ferredoxin oxidoreductase subunit beta